MKRFLLLTLLLVLYIVLGDFIFSVMGVKIASNDFERHLSKFIPKEEWHSTKKFFADIEKSEPRGHTIKGTFLKKYYPFKSDTYNVNSVGFRTHEVVAKKKNEIRIIVTGASVIWGNVAPDSKTIPAYMEREFRKQYPDKMITVYNLGVEANDLPRIVETVKMVADTFKPDLVVVFFGGIYTWYSQVNYPFDYQLAKEDKPLYTPSAETGIFKKIKKKIVQYSLGTLLYNQLEKSLHSTTPFNPIHFQARKSSEKQSKKEKIAILMKAIFLQIKSLDSFAQQHSFKTIYFYQPLLSQKKCKTSVEKDVAHYFFDTVYPGLEDFYATATRTLNQEVRRRNIVNVKDATGAFDNSCDTMFWDVGHLTPEGYKVMGHYMAKSIINDNIIPNLSKESR